MSTDINNSCVTTLRSAWHLRPTAVAADTGSRAYPGGDRVELLSEAPHMVRGASEKGYNVKVVADGQTGYAFIPVADIPAACQQGALSTTGSSIVDRIFPASNGLVKAVGGSTNAAIATTVVVAAVGYYFLRKPSDSYVMQVPRSSLASNPHKPKQKRRR